MPEVEEWLAAAAGYGPDMISTVCVDWGTSDSDLGGAMIARLCPSSCDTLLTITVPLYIDTGICTMPTI